MDPAAASSPSLGWVSLAQSGLALVLVCVAAALLIRFWGRWRRARSNAAGVRLERVASLQLGVGASVHIVRSGSQQLLLGVTAAGVTLLDKGPATESSQLAPAQELATPLESASLTAAAVEPQPGAPDA